MPEAKVDEGRFRALVERRSIYRIPGMEAVEVERDIIYKSEAGTELGMDIYRPPNLGMETTRAGVILVHGGPISPQIFPESVRRPKDWGAYTSYGELLAASGFVGITFNYRFHGLQSLDRAASDLIDAVRFVRQHAAKVQLDKDRLALWVFSGAGALLTLPLRDSPQAIKALVAYYPLLDFSAFVGMGLGRVTPETARAYTPANHLLPDGVYPPLFLARAGLDQPATCDGIDAFVRCAVNSGMSVDYLNHPQGIHAFDLFNDDVRSRQILAHTFVFLNDHLETAPSG